MRGQNRGQDKRTQQDHSSGPAAASQVHEKTLSLTVVGNMPQRSQVQQVQQHKDMFRPAEQNHKNMHFCSHKGYFKTQHEHMLSFICPVYLSSASMPYASHLPCSCPISVPLMSYLLSVPSVLCLLSIPSLPGPCLLFVPLLSLLCLTLVLLLLSLHLL